MRTKGFPLGMSVVVLAEALQACRPGAPAFDLLPNVNDNLEHVLSFDLNPTIKADELADLGRRWGITRAKSIVEDVRGVMPQYADIADDCGVPTDDILRFCHGVD